MILTFVADNLFKFVSRAVIHIYRAKARQACLETIIKDWGP